MNPLIDASLILLCATITALICNGLLIAAGEGMILEPLGLWLDSKFIKVDLMGTKHVSKIYYPILYCPRCMPSLYGTIVCLCVLPFSVNLCYQIPFTVLSAVVFSTIISDWYE